MLQKDRELYKDHKITCDNSIFPYFSKIRQLHKISKLWPQKKDGHKPFNPIQKNYSMLEKIKDNFEVIAKNSLYKHRILVPYYDHSNIWLTSEN